MTANMLLALVMVFFSPKGGCTSAIVDEIGKARVSVRVQAYSFTSEPVEKALERAKARGLTVEVILDRSWQNQAPKVEAELVAAGITVWIDARHAIAHNKVIVIDGKTVVTGSFNFTNQAETRNAENVIILRGNAKVAAKYFENWTVHKSHSLPPGG